MSLEKFAETKLSSFLGFEVPKEMIDHLMSLKTIKDVREFFENLLDVSDSKQRQFINDFIEKKKLNGGYANKQKQSNAKTKQSENVVVVDKKMDMDVLEKQYQVQNKKINNEREKESYQKEGVLPNAAKSIQHSISKFKKAIQPIDFNKKLPLLPGRRFCGCFAKQHKLVNNCTGCGRVACEQEGSGPCMFCGILIVTKAEKALLDSETEKGNKLRNKLLTQPKPHGWERAVEIQTKMRNADLARKERQRIIDDQSDYFSLVGDCSTLKDCDNNSKKGKIKNEIIFETEKSTTKEFKRSLGGKSDTKKAMKKEKGIKFDDKWRLTTASSLTDNVTEFGIIDENVEKFLEKIPEMKMIEYREKLFFQDPRTLHICDMNPDSPDYDWENEFWELNDYFDRFGLCISIQQPWASLIMAGIKKFEGRSVEFAYRGVMWIAAGSREPSTREIKTAEDFYRRINENKKINFPKSYPTGRLLGRAQIQHCYDNQEFLQKFPEAEVDDDFVLVLKQVIPLPILFPMKGCSGIYFLPKKLHTAAGILIRKVIRENPDLSVMD